MAITPTITAPEGRVFSIFASSTAGVVSPELRVFTVYNLPTESEAVAEVRVLTPSTGNGGIQVAQTRVFAIARGRLENRKMRAWTFSLDGHDFYVVRLGENSTLVYDLTTQQWADWTSEELSFWRVNTGFNWVGMGPLTMSKGAQSKVVVGDDSTGTLWTLDPNIGVDEAPREERPDTTFPRRVVGGVPMEMRNTLKVGAVYLSADMGTPQSIGANITLRTSDDNGKTYNNHGTITVEPGNYDQEFVWRSLGLIRSPGRIFELSDDGATVRIDGLDMR